MSTVLGSNDAFDRALEPVLGLFSPDLAAQIADYHSDPALQTRIEELAAKANEGDLTEAERMEYEGYAQANRFLAILQAKARKRRDSSGPR